jgi:spermidine synthase
LTGTPKAVTPKGGRVNRWIIYLIVFAAGVAALSWEVLWQLESSLALGVSARGTAITLAAMMGGMTVGSLLAARILQRHPPKDPLRVYGLVELSIALFGQALEPGFKLLEHVDSALYSKMPDAAPFIHFVGIAMLLGLPAMSMGATLPLFGLIAESRRSSIAWLYALNTAGASFGALLIAFVIIPAVGVSISIGVFSSIGVFVALVARLLPSADAANDDAPRPSALDESTAGWTLAVAFMTGFATFALEVTWFRALKAAFESTTDTFAIIVAAVLIPIALGATLARTLERRGITIAHLLVSSAALILLTTPIVERFDLFASYEGYYLDIMVKRFLLALGTLGPPVLVLGAILPSLLEKARALRGWGRIYATNTLGAIGGSIAAAWILLPLFGVARTAWAIALMLAIAGTIRAHRITRWVSAVAVPCALVIAVAGESGVGRKRIIAPVLRDMPYEILAFREGPDSTVSVVDAAHARQLFIDGFSVSGEQGVSSYMVWMGALPMLLHPDPKNGLVICFGTGQTANGLRRERPESLDIVDINPAVFALGHLFAKNEGILDDPRVRTFTMDGRAWLRRTEKRYDVITLEPMPPYYAGTNALYSKEFYELARARLSRGGIVAQWMPYHLVSVSDATSIAATFRAVFPDSILWFDPNGATGIMLGRTEAVDGALGTRWPGLERRSEKRLLTDADIEKWVALDVAGFERYASLGRIITDDNQRLAYGHARREMPAHTAALELNIQLMKKARHDQPP